VPITAVACLVVVRAVYYTALVVVASIILVGRSLKVCQCLHHVCRRAVHCIAVLDHDRRLTCVFSYATPMWLIYLQLANNALWLACVMHGPCVMVGSTSTCQRQSSSARTRSADLIARV